MLVFVAMLDYHCRGKGLLDRYLITIWMGIVASAYVGIYLMWELFVEYMVQVFGGSHSIVLGWAYVLCGFSWK